MTEKTRSSIVYTCDRCGNEGEFTEAPQYACWAQINTQHKDGSSLLPFSYNADLCVDCAVEFGEWFSAGKAKAPVCSDSPEALDDNRNLKG